MSGRKRAGLSPEQYRDSKKSHKEMDASLSDQTTAPAVASATAMATAPATARAGTAATAAPAAQAGAAATLRGAVDTTTAMGEEDLSTAVDYGDSPIDDGLAHPSSPAAHSDGARSRSPMRSRTPSRSPSRSRSSSRSRSRSASEVDEQYRPSTPLYTPTSVGTPLTEAEMDLISPCSPARPGEEAGEVAEAASGERPIVSNSSDRSEEMALIRAAPERVPWMPSSRFLNESRGVKIAGHPIPIFDITDLPMTGILEPRRFVSGEARLSFVVTCFFKQRWYKDPSSLGKLTTQSLGQAWNAFVSNVRHNAFDAWYAKLDDVIAHIEQHSPAAGKVRLHRMCKAAGFPCLVRQALDCPQCLPGSLRAPPEAHDISDRTWGPRVPLELREALEALEDLLERKNASRSSGGRGGEYRGAPRETERQSRTAVRDQGRRQGEWSAVPSYPQTADSHANVRESYGSYDYSPPGHGGPGGAPQSSAQYHWNPPAAPAVVGTQASPGIVQVTAEVAAERACRLAMETTLRAELAQLRAELQAGAHYRQGPPAQELRAELQRARDEHALLVADHKRLLGVLQRHGIQGVARRHRTDGTDGDDQRRT